MSQKQVDRRLRPFNDAVESAALPLRHLASHASKLANGLKVFEVFENNPVWKALQTVAQALGKLLQPFNNLLRRKLGISYPWVEMRTKKVRTKIMVPKVRKKCKKKWRIKICWPVPYLEPKYVTINVKYPVAVMRRFETTIQAMLNGALRAADVIMKPLNALLDKILKAIPLPKIEIPLPPFPNLDLKIFDEVQRRLLPLKNQLKAIDVPFGNPDVPKLCCENC